LANGCRAVIPAEEIVEAEEIARSLKEPTENVLLGGERGGERVPGFPHGNSPLEYTPEVVTGKVLVLTTTNGTRAIRRAARDASAVFVGSLLNARAVARELQRLQADAALVCAGTNGDFSLEDALAAGTVIREMLPLARGENHKSRPEKRPGPGHPRNPEPARQIEPETFSVNLSDSAMAVYRLALWYGGSLFRAFHDSRHGQKLLRLGLAADLEYCSRLNLFDLVPVYREGIIILLNKIEPVSLN
ncbi:MAG: 2-phosphosulfolactate phosphatase, partial [Bacillota bacterium]